MRIVRLRGMLAAAVALAAAAAASAQTTRASAFEKLDPDRLAKALGEMGMADLLASLPADQQVAGLRGLAAMRLRAATKAVGPERDAMMDQVVEDYRRIIASGAEPKTQQQKLDHWRDQIELASLLGVTKVDLAVGRLLYLKANSDDAAMVRKATTNAVKMFDELIPQLREKTEEFRDDWEAIAMGIPQALTQMIRTAEYRAAWARFNLATAMRIQSEEGATLTEEQEQRRQRLLGDAAAAVIDYAEGPAKSGVKYPSLLLCGMAVKDRGEFENAAGFLQRAAEQQDNPQTRLQALFELTKLAVVEHKWPLAEKHAKAYQEFGESIYKQDDRILIDLHVALLRNHILLRHAAVAEAKDPKAAAELRQQAQEQFVTLFKTYPQRSTAIANLIGRKYADVDDIKSLDSVIVYAKGVVLVSGSEDDQKKAIACFELVRSRDDETSKQFHALCAWQTIVAEYNLGKDMKGIEGWKKRQKAADLAREFSVDFPTDPNARNAATSAAAIYKARIDALVDAKAPVPAGVRDGYVESALAAIAQFKDAPAEAAAYYYPLARQYEALGKYDEALKFYKRVSPASVDYPLAAYNALVLRTRTLDALNGVKRAEEAAQLVNEMRAYVANVRKQLPGLDAQKRSILARQGANIDFLVARLLNQDLGKWQEAIAHSLQLKDRWPDNTELAQLAWGFRIQVWLQRDKTSQAVESLNAFRQAYPEKAKELVSSVAFSIRDRMNSLKRAGGREDELDEWRKLYYKYSAYADEVTKDLPAKERFPFRLMLADSMVETGRTDEAMAIYAELLKQDDADYRILRGQARCFRAQKKYFEALKLYKRLTDKLDYDANTNEWWRIDLERIRCALEYAKSHPEALPSVRTMLKQAETKNKNTRAIYGGLQVEFNTLTREVDRLLDQK